MRWKKRGLLPRGVVEKKFVDHEEPERTRNPSRSLSLAQRRDMVHSAGAKRGGQREKKGAERYRDRGGRVGRGWKENSSAGRLGWGGRVRVRRFLLISRQAAGRYRLLQFRGRAEEPWVGREKRDPSEDERNEGRRRQNAAESEKRRGGRERRGEKRRGWAKSVARPGQRYCRTRRTCTSAITREQGGRGVAEGCKMCGGAETLHHQHPQEVSWYTGTHELFGWLEREGEREGCGVGRGWNEGSRQRA